MDAVESVRDTLEADAQEGEETGTLPKASVDALYKSGLLRLKLPRVLGGAEADLVTQLDVLEAVSEIEPSAGWCLMIGAASLGGVGAFLPDDAIEEIFAEGKPPKTRGYTSVNPLARRPAFQRMLSESDLRLRAARALNVEILEEAWRVVCDGHPPSPPLQAQMRSVCTYSTDVAADVVSQAFRFAGGAALFESSVLQRCLRDINAGAQHQMVSDTAYENHGQFMLGLPDAKTME